jgi:hypothetical protein
MKVSGQLHAQGTLTLGREPWYPMTGSWVGPKAIWMLCSREQFLPLLRIESCPSMLKACLVLKTYSHYKLQNHLAKTVHQDLFK